LIYRGIETVDGNGGEVGNLNRAHKMIK
jgi:hypothetical protein